MNEKLLLRSNYVWIFFLLFSFIFSLIVKAQTGWNSQDWQYRRAITINNSSSSPLNNFQVKVSLNSSFDFGRCNADGSDIRFTSDDEQTLIPYWIEEWNPSGTAASIWVKVPNIPSGGTTIYLYYSNPSATFPVASSPTTTNLPPTGPWTNVSGLSISGLNGGLLAENMVEDGGVYWQLFTDRNVCNGQLGFAKNTTGNPANASGWTWWNDVQIDFSIRNSVAMFADDPRLNTTAGNLLNPYLDCPHIQKGDDGNWYLFYHWIVGGDPHGSCGVHGAWSWTSDAYAAIGVAKASSITGPYTEINPNLIMSAQMEGTNVAWDWARVSEPYVFKRDDGKWIMLFMGDKGNYDDPGNPNLYYIEQCSYAIADNIDGPYTKWHNGTDPFIAFGPSGSLDAGTIADAHPVKFGNTWYIFYAASPSTFGWSTMYATTTDWESLTKSTSYVYTTEGNSPFRGAISKFNDIYYFSYLGSSPSSSGPFMIATQPATGTIPGENIYGAESVFDFYDNFEGTALNSTKWGGVDPGYSGTVSVSTGDMVICNSGGFLTEVTAKQSFGVGYMFESRAKHSSYGFAGEIGFGRLEPGSSWSGPPFGFKNQRIMDLRAISGSGFVVDADNAEHVESPGDYVTTTTPLSYDYMIHKVMRLDNNTVRFQLDENPVTTITNTVDRPTRVTTDALAPWFFILGGSCMNVDWVRVRKYTEPELTFTMGDEELYHCYADLSITKTVDNPSPNNGDDINFTITIRNDGPGNSAWAKVSDVIPNGLQFVSYTTDNGTYDPILGVWNIGFLSVGSTSTLNIKVHVDLFTAVFDFGSAAGFNLFAFNDITQPSSDTQGKIAVGHDAHFGAYSVGDQLPNSSGTEDVLVVGNDLTFTSGAVYGGNVVYGNTTNLPQSSVSILNGTLRQDSPIDFALAKTNLITLSSQLSGYTVNGTTTIQWGGITLNGSDPYLNVFSVQGPDLSSANTVTVNVPNGAVVLVNVNGTSVSWMGGLTVNGTAITNVLYNFYQASTLTIQGIDIRGSILAPLATINFPAGLISGQVICNNLVGAGQINLNLFSGNIPLPSDVCNIAEIIEADQSDRDSKPGNGVITEDDYAKVDINVNLTGGTGSTDGWKYVGQFAAGEIVYALAYDQGGNILAGTLGGKIYRSSNSGQSFTRINTSMYVGIIWSLAVNSSGVIFAGTEQGVFSSADNGASWSMIGLAFKDVRSLAIDHNGDIYASTWGFGVFKSTDNGITWIEVNSGLTSAVISTLSITSGSTIFAGTFGNGIYKSLDHGGSWTHQSLGYNLIWALGVTSTDVLFAGSYGDGLYRSTDIGANWTKLTSGINAPFIYSIQVDLHDNIYVSSWTSGVYASSDFGNSWTSLGMGGFGVSSILVNPSMNVLYAGTKEGKLYVKNNDVTAVEQKKEIPTEFSLKQNYPNPFNPSTVIEFGLPAAGRYALKVFNILGQTVRVLADKDFSAGYQKITFNASELSSGIYFYQLFGEKVNLIKKMILVK
jgi:choice-of-anchor A domain-containing protein/uncharacterized repeat protein (TIGR01451 family)